jgi:beta-mannosidase
MRAHEKHPTGFETIRAYLERRWPVPPDDSLDAWSYVSQLAQAEGVGLALEAHRRSWPRTGGTLFWQLNDTWPAVSWSSVDALGRWKALQYEARRIFAPIAVLADAWGASSDPAGIEASDTVAAWIAADGPVSGRLAIRVLDFDGNELARRDTTVDGSGLAWQGTPSALLPPGTDPHTVHVHFDLHTAGGDVVSDDAFLVPPKDLRLPDPHLRVVSAKQDEDVWTVVVQADHFAYAVRIGAAGVPVHAEPDYVHLEPGVPLEIRVRPERSTPDLPRRLRLRSLADLLHR